MRLSLTGVRGTTSEPAARVRPRRRITVIAVAVVLGFGLFGCSGDDGNDGPSPTGVVLPAPSSEAGDPSPSREVTPSGGSLGGAEPVAAVVRDPEAEVEAEDQSGNGSEVTVEEVELSSGPGHLVVVARESQTVLGTSAVRPGSESSIAVTLAPPLDRDQTLAVMLFADDGDGRFDPATDGRIVDDEGEPVLDDLDYRLQ
jgi:hypothetical protein